MKPLGRNQWIAAAGYGLPLLITAGGCLAAGMAGSIETALDKWISFTQLYVPIAMGSILGLAAGLKAVRAVKQ